ncbi:hypothetical protein GUJ93_ZPchr0002g24187 [Zizania palustris]|uniref:LOB domain-containing protein n=1 Tax=Zizania palustris TaxID=103762 RepID=A0A8J5SJB0_ZIZPA|nr:hypothetical protein GUJ93_ZPchr0002g24187 [Zizania palustris]
MTTTPTAAAAAAAAAGGGAMTSTATSSASSVSTGSDISSESNSEPPPPQRLLDRGIATTTADNSGSSTGGGGGPGPTTAEAQLRDAGRLPRVRVGGWQSHACAACRFQRCKCTPDCQLAPYFPGDDERRFLTAHHLFGVSNIKKILEFTPPDLHQDAMLALTYEAEARAQDPVGGAAHIVMELSHVYNAVLAELATVHHHLALRRQEAAAANHANDVLMANHLAAMLLAGAGLINQYDPVPVVNNALYIDQQIAGEAAVVQAGGGVLQEQYEAQVQQPPQNYFYHRTAGDEGSSHAWSHVDSVQDFGNGGEAKPPIWVSSLYQIEAAPFLELINVKPELPTTMGDNGSVGHVEQQDSKAPPP